MAKRKKKTEPKAVGPIRDRIKEFRRVKASELSANPRNWRTHPQAQQDALRGILAEIGYADALLARELPDGKLELIDGHLRAETTPDQEVPVLILDVDEDEANKLLTVLDPLGAMAEANKEALGQLLAEAETSDKALQAMLDDMKLQIADDISVVPEESPESVAENIAEIEDIKRQRREGNANTASKNDTERYMVVVYPTREAREQSVSQLGLPIDERYVAASSVDVRLKGGPIPLRFSDGVSRKAADKKFSGAGG